jgi:metallo-beta-lactamase class B
MNRREYLLNQFDQSTRNWLTHKKAFYTTPANAAVAPFKIADGLWYVGDTQVCAHLIDSDDGLILIDSGYPCAKHLLVESIWRAGFDPKDVRWILHTHGHFDHFGASEDFRRLYGTKLAISRVDAVSLREKPYRAHLDLANDPYATIPTFDRELEDGEIFSLGRVHIRCVLTPGHSAGVMSFFFHVTEGGMPHLAGLYGGAGLNAMTLPYMTRNDDPLDCPEQMLRSIERIWDEPVDIHLGNHPGNNHTLEKRAKQLQDGGNPFVDPESWHTFLQNLQASTENIIAQNATLERELTAMFGEQ